MAMEMVSDSQVLQSLPVRVPSDTTRQFHEEEEQEQEAHGKPKKKHSGPRKRRPKKPKKTETDNTTTADVDDDDDTVGKHALSIDTTPLASLAAIVKLKSLRAAAVPFIPISPSKPIATTTTTAATTTTTATEGAHVGMDDLALGFSLPSPPLIPMGSSTSPLFAYHAHTHHHHLHHQHHSSPMMLPKMYMGDFGSESEFQQLQDRAYWTKYVIEAAEKERARRLRVLHQLQQDEEEEIRRRRAWAIAAIEQEQQNMMREMFLDNMKNTQWFQSTISRLDHDYEVVCPNSWFGCTFSCMLKDLESHLENCVYRQVPDRLDQVGDDALAMDFDSYDVVCPNAMLGCSAIFPREELAAHLLVCPLAGITREREWQERQEWQQNVIEMTEEERQRRMNEPRETHDDKFSFGHLQRLYEEQTAMMHVLLHDEMVQFTYQCDHAAERVRPAIDIAIGKLKQEIAHLWGAPGRSDVLVESYGSFATRLHGGHSDVDLVVFGATTGEAGSVGMTSQQCVSHLATHLSSCEPSSGLVYKEISAITRATIPLVKVVVRIPRSEMMKKKQTRSSSSSSSSSSTGDQKQEDEEHEEDIVEIPFDITFDDPSDATPIVHNGIASAALVTSLMEHFYGLRELTLVLKHFLATRGLNDPYFGGLSSYGLVLMVLFVLREQGALLCTVPSGDPSEGEGGETIQNEEAGEEQQEISPSSSITTIHDPSCSSSSSASRYAAQRQKGLAIAEEILLQARARQRALIAADAMDTSAHNKRRSMTAAWEVLGTMAITPPGKEYAGSPVAAASFVATPPQQQQQLPRSSDHHEHHNPPFLLGKLLMAFLQWYGNDFRHNLDQIAVLTAASDVLTAASAGGVASPLRSIVASPTGMRIPVVSSPTHPLPPLPPPLSPLFPSSMSSSDPTASLLVIQDPLQRDNNVGKTCYRVSQVLRDFSDFLSVLTALIVRGSVLPTGASVVGSESDTVDGSPRILSSVFHVKQAAAAASNGGAATATTAGPTA